MSNSSVMGHDKVRLLTINKLLGQTEKFRKKKVNCTNIYESLEKEAVHVVLIVRHLYSTIVVSVYFLHMITKIRSI